MISRLATTNFTEVATGSLDAHNERVTVAPFAARDADTLAAHVREDDGSIGRYMNYAAELSTSQGFIDYVRDDQKFGKHFQTVFHDNQPVGLIQILPKSASIIDIESMWVSHRFRGRRIMPSALRRVYDHYLRASSAKIVQLAIRTDNEPSRIMNERLGAERVGYDATSEHDLYAMTARRWRYTSRRGPVLPGI